MMGGWGNGYGYGYGGCGRMGTMGLIMPLIIGIGIILLVIYFFRHHKTTVQTGEFGSPTNALDILRERYARGEIDSAEFQNRKQDLEGK